MAKTKHAKHAQETTHNRRKSGTIDRESYLQRAKEFCLRGFDLPQTKVPPLAVIAIREAARTRDRLRQEITDKYSNKALAKQWGVHEKTIEKILSYETAKHIL